MCLRTKKKLIQNKIKMRLIYHTLEFLWMHSNIEPVMCIESHSIFQYIWMYRKGNPLLSWARMIYSYSYIDRIQVTIFYYCLFRLRFCVVPMGFPLPQFCGHKCVGAQAPSCEYVPFVCRISMQLIFAQNSNQQQQQQQQTRKNCILVSFVRIVVVL